MGGGGADNNRILRIVLTGGPCAGKTTCLGLVKQHLADKGFAVCTVPETSTFLLSNGASYPSLDEDKRHIYQQFEDYFLSLHLKIEETFANIVSLENGPKALIYDRAIMDIKAYVPEDVWKKMLLTAGFASEEEVFAKYDYVIHLVTVANGATTHYGIGTNDIRMENPEQARELDNLTFKNWSAHHNVVRIANSESVQDGFEIKKKDTFAALDNFLSTQGIVGKQSS